MITRIEVHNYRCFPRLTIDLNRYHVLAGANGAGKTTLLDIPVLIGDLCQRGGIVAASLERQGSSRAPRAGALTDPLRKGQSDAIAFAVEAKLPSPVTDVLGEMSMARIGRPVPTHLRYELRVEITTHRTRVADEYLFLFPEGDDRPRAGAFPQGRSAAETNLANERWQALADRTAQAAEAEGSP